jgi:hypothetical protein
MATARAEPISLDSPNARYVTALAERLRALGPDATLELWLDAPPVVIDIDDRVAPHPIEEAFDRESGALRTVCHKPHARLQTVEEVQVASRVRTVAASSLSRLAAHPEDWAARTPTGVRPRRVLARRAEADVDIYENRVAVATLAVLRGHLQRRLADVHSLTMLVQDVLDLQAPAARSSWTVHTRLWGLLRNLGDLDHKRAAARDRLTELESALRAVESMFASPLGRAVDARSDLPITLHPSNLLSGNHQYRRVAALWNACAAVSSQEIDEAQKEKRLAELHDAFTKYATLLLVQACTLIDAKPGPGQRVPEPGGRVKFDLHGEPLAVEWTEAGFLTVAWAGSEVLRVRPVLTDFESANNSDVVNAQIAWPHKEANNRTGNAHKRGAPPAPMTLTVYPGLRADRERCSGSVREALYRIMPHAPAIAPISPLEVASVSRLVRALRWATLAKSIQRYPTEFAVSDKEREALTGGGWLVGSDAARTIAAVRPPTTRQLEAARNIVASLRQRTDRARGVGDNSARIAELEQEVDRAAAALRGLTLCPTCPELPDGEYRSFTDRGDGLFSVSCANCRTRWGLRRCEACGARFPLLFPVGKLGRGGGEEELDRVYGGDLLAVSCWAADEAVHAICPSCGVCGDSSAKALVCPRLGCTRAETA